MRFRLVFVIAVASVLLFGCKTGTDEQLQPSPDLRTSAGDILIVNEGLFQRNNSTLSLITTGGTQAITDVFEQVNRLKLGDTGNDIDVYGNKIYLVVNVSSYVAVLDKSTLKLLKQIPLIDGSRARQPRQLAFADGLAYVTCFDGKVAMIDTSTLSVSGFLDAGRNPEGIVTTQQYIVVANSGGLSAPNFDNRIMVYDRSNKQLVKTITVADNPTSLIAIGHDSVVCYSRRSSTTGSMAELQTVDLESGQITSTLLPAGSLAQSGDSVKYLYADGGRLKVDTWVQNKPSQRRLTLLEGQVMTPYNFVVEPVTGKLLITDARDYVSTGQLKFFSRSGQLVKSINVGLNPGALTVIR